MDNELLDIIRMYLQKNLKENKSIEEKNPFNTAAAAAKNKGDKEFEFPKGSGKMHPVTMDDETAKNIIKSENEDLQEKSEKQKASDIPGYRKGRSKKQLKALDKETKRVQDAKKKGKKMTDADYERIEKRRMKELPKGTKTPKNPYSKNETLTRNQIRSLLEQVALELINEKKKKKKKKKLSAKTMETLRKKAKKSGYTAGSLASEYRKGLGAYYSSGSRKGMSAHQWAMARVNSAIGKGNPSWANLKRSKKKK